MTFRSFISVVFVVVIVCPRRELSNSMPVMVKITPQPQEIQLNLL